MVCSNLIAIIHEGFRLENNWSVKATIAQSGLILGNRRQVITNSMVPNKLINQHVSKIEQIKPMVISGRVMVQLIQNVGIHNGAVEEVSEYSNLPSSGLCSGLVIAQLLIKLISGPHSSIIQHNDGGNANQGLTDVFFALLHNPRHRTRLGHESGYEMNRLVIHPADEVYKFF